MSWIFGEPPTRGSRFVALFDDGSGAELFVWGDDGHLLDADGDDHGVMDGEDLEDWLYESGHWCWTALPEGYAVGLGVTDVFSHTRLGSVMDAEGKLRLPMWATNAERVSWFEDAGFAFWLPLPDRMRLFYEGQS